MNNKIPHIEYKDRFTITEYYLIVNTIVDGFFGDDGSYTPHIGDMVAMLTFFNECVMNKHDIIDADRIDDVLEADELFANDEFISSFNEAIYFDGDIKYDFANAFKNAMEIVANKNNSIPLALNNVMNSISEIVETTNEMLTEENINKLTDFANAVAQSNFNAKSVADAFATTDAFQKILEFNQGKDK